MEGSLLLFDLDGTLIDSVPDLCAALNEVLSEYGRPPLLPSEVQPMVGDGMPALVARGFAARGLDPAAAQQALPRYVAVYEANATRLTHPYPHVHETLETLRRMGYRTAVCTNKLQGPTLTVLRGLDLLRLFDGIAGGDRFAVRKPDPGHLLGLIKELGGGTQSAAMVGDAENDAAAAHAAGLPLILMRYGYARVDPGTLGADAVLDDFADLPPTLQRLGITPSMRD
ncbi:MAG: phosphoglycolate phosphatase [Alphaproteobacteria bacterium]|nr:phosphoglycolate phosphatase [Alphaproteobacteria bacterium]